MKSHAITYILLTATLLMGCGGRTDMHQLEELEAQLDTAPHLVLQALDSIPVAKLRGEKRALYAILKTQADYKCYRPLTTDTLIRYATTYYDDDRKSYRAATAWYSLGCVYSELHDDAAAIDAYLQAQSLFPDTTARYYRLCYQNLGNHYLQKKMVDEALSAYRLYQNVAKGYDRIYADIGLAQAYILKRKPREASELLENLLLYREEIDTTSLENILFELGKIEYIFNKNYDKADDYFNQLIAQYDEGDVDVAHWFKGAIAEKQKNIPQAIRYYKMAMLGNDDTYLQYNCARSLLYLTLDSITHPELYSYIKLFEQTSDSINRIERRSEIDKIHNKHSLELQQRELSIAHQHFTYRAALIIASLIAMAAIILLVVERNRRLHYLRLQRKLQRNQSRIYKMYESIEEKRDNGALMREQVLVLYRENLSVGIDLFNKEEWGIRLRKLSEHRSKEVSSLTHKERELLAEALERCFANVITNLHDEATRNNSKLKSEDIHLCLFLSLGYSTGVIRECLAVGSDDSVRKRKVRLAGKLPEDILKFFLQERKYH